MPKLGGGHLAPPRHLKSRFTHHQSASICADVYPQEAPAENKTGRLRKLSAFLIDPSASSLPRVSASEYAFQACGDERTPGRRRFSLWFSHTGNNTPPGVFSLSYLFLRDAHFNSRKVLQTNRLAIKVFITKHLTAN